MKINSILCFLICCLTMAGCGGGDKESDGKNPVVGLTVVSYDDVSATLEVRLIEASYAKIICKATGVATSETAQSVAQNGVKYTGSTIKLEGLSAQTTYTIFAVGCNDAGQYGAMETLRLKTKAQGPQMYSWEASRKGILSYTDMVLCYGGSRHRTPYLWNKDRFAPCVTYVDPEGEEHWLFDSFLFIEFQSTSRPDGGYYAYMLGLMKDYGFSAGKSQWKELIDYWFASQNGMSALEESVKTAATRIGAPASKRKVVMILPDPIIYKVFDGKGNGSNDPSSTTYWGELDGRVLDFSTADDRIAAYKWYIDEVRRRFDAGNYQYIDLAGFYIISEELATPNDGWNYELKKSDEITPPIAEYLHSINQSLNWIPYNCAAGYTKWKQLGVDYAYMQPNYFWKGDKSLTKYFADVKAYGLGMEFEFDEALLAGKQDSEQYRTRFRAYMSGAKTSGVYGTKPLSYYHGTNALYDLSKSSAAEDQKLYHEFCQFVLDNPSRNQ